MEATTASGPASPLVIGAVDGGEGTAGVVALACVLARLLDARVLLAHVYPGAGVFSPLPARGREEPPPRDAEDVLLGAASSASGIDDVELRAIAGRSVGRALDSLAREERASVVVVGATQHEGRVRALAASTAERLIHGAQTAVAVAPAGPAAPAHERTTLIGCAFDGSPEAKQALAAAERLAAKDRAALELITWVDASDEDAQARAKELGENTIAGFSGRSAMEAVAAPDEGEEALGERSGELDLLVCGSRAYGPLHTVLLGGFSTRLLHAAHCPVLIVPRGADPNLALAPQG